MPANSLLLKQILLSRPLADVTDSPFSLPGCIRCLAWQGGSRFESLAVQWHVKNVPHVGTTGEK